MHSFCVHSFSDFGFIFLFTYKFWTHRLHDCMVVRFATSCAISAYHHLSCEFKSRLWEGVLNTTLCEKFVSDSATGWWFSQVSSTNKTDCHDLTEILLKMALNIITLTLLTNLSFPLSWFSLFYFLLFYIPRSFSFSVHILFTVVLVSPS